MPQPLFSATLAGSLPKPAWWSETNKLWPQCTLPGPMTIVDTVADWGVKALAQSAALACQRDGA